MSLEPLPRSSWTSTKPGFPRYPGRRIKQSRVVAERIHYPGDGNRTREGLSLEQVAALLRGYRNYHVGTRGWADIGYVDAVDQAGRAYVLAGYTHAAAHSATGARPNENYHSLGTLFVIGNNERPTQAMIDTYRQLRDYHRRIGFTNLSTLTDHSGVPGASTSCAGPHVRELIRAGAFDLGGKLPAVRPLPPAGGHRRGQVPGTGITVAADGDFGRWTKTAYQERLKAVGLPSGATLHADGDFGRFSVLAEQEFLRRKGQRGHAIDGARGPYTIRSLQAWLRAQGYRGHAIDGDFGRYTVTSLQHALLDGKVK